MDARRTLLWLLRARSRALTVQGGRPAFSRLDALQEAAEDALAEFRTIHALQGLDPEAREIVERMFLRYILTLNVATDMNPERAREVGHTVDKAMAWILAPKPTLRVVK